MRLVDRTPRFGALVLAALGLVFGGAQAARAQLDLGEVEFNLTIRHEHDLDSASGTTFAGSFVVRGTGIEGVTITPPGGQPVVLRETSPDEFTQELEIDSDSDLPDGDYLLDLNDGERTATLAYDRAEVPSPSISFADSVPVDDGRVPPGPVEIVFVPCTVCTQVEDATHAQLEEGGEILASSDSLEPPADSWVPSDAAGPIELDPTSEFVVRVEHTAVRTFALQAAPRDPRDPRDPFDFRTGFVQGDALEFGTGFAAPEAALCIVVNDLSLDPEGRCFVHEDRYDAIFDPSVDPLDPLATTAAGVPIEYSFTASPTGRLTGIADVDLDGDGSFETHVPVKGRLSGEGGRLRQRVSFSATGPLPAPRDKLAVRIQERTDTAALLRTHVENARGRLGGSRVRETTSDTAPVDPAEARGWRLDFTLSGPEGAVSGAEFTLADGPTPGRKVPLVGRHRFLFDENRTHVRLRSEGAERGVEIKIDTLALDDTAVIEGGLLRYRALGQSRTFKLH